MHSRFIWFNLNKRFVWIKDMCDSPKAVENQNRDLCKLTLMYDDCDWLNDKLDEIVTRQPILIWNNYKYEMYLEL